MTIFAFQSIRSTCSLSLSVHLSLLTFLLCLISSTDANKHASTPPHVCIIGAGISGAVTADMLSRLRPTPKLSVFEKSNRVGGRIQSLYACGDDNPIEAGASIIASGNLLMRTFANELGLTRRVSRLNKTTLALWDDHNGNFVLRTSTSKIRSTYRILNQYGWSLVRSRRFVHDLFQKYILLYPSTSDIYSGWNASRTVHDLLSNVDLFNMSQVPLSHIAQHVHRLSDRYLHEMVAAITRVNYGQDVIDMHALAGAVSLAGSANDLWSIEGGNVRLVEGLLKRSGSTLHFGKRIRAIRRASDMPYTLYINEGDKQDVTEDEERIGCDAVVLAAPAELANISLPHDISDTIDVGRIYQKTVATFVRGYLRKNTFEKYVKFNSEDLDSTHVLSISGERFTSIGKQCEADSKNGHEYPLWKVFSRNDLTPSDIEYLFENDARIVAHFPWFAYPKFRIPEHFAPFDVDDVQHAFFYTAPLESAGSAMEMCSVAAANVAALVRDRFELQDKDLDYSKSDL